jgi:hypothetical protein
LIEETAYNYTFAMANYNVDQAEPYATEETKNTTFVMAKKLMQAVGNDYIASDTPAKIEIVNVEKKNDTVAIAIYHKTTPIKDFSDTLNLRKRNSQWLAHAPISKVKTEKTDIPQS